MIRFIFCLMCCIHMETMGFKQTFKVDNRKQYYIGHVCNYEVKLVSTLRFLLYTCVPSSMCKKVGGWTKSQRQPELHFDNCNGSFIPRPDGDPYVCCHPADNLESVQDGEVPRVPYEIDWMPGFRSAFKCKDYGSLVCLGRSNCPDTSNRIVKGGTETTIGKYPHLAVIGYYNNETKLENWFCLGSIISEDFILTAASCRQDDKGYYASVVRVGETELCKLGEGCPYSEYAQHIRILTHYPHPANNPEYFYHDIMLLKLSWNITFNHLVRPACLMNEFNTFEAGGMFALYEQYNKNGKLVNRTHDMELQIFSTVVCSRWYNFNVRMEEGQYDRDIQFCAGKPQTEQEPCEFDYGGPITVQRDSPFCAWWIYGVMAYSSHFFCKGTLPPMFTRVAFYIDWIERTVWPNFDMFKQHNTCRYRCKDALVAPGPREGSCPYIPPNLFEL